MLKQRLHQTEPNGASAHSTPPDEQRYVSMTEVTHDDYLKFVANTREVEIEHTKVALKGPYHSAVNHPPLDYRNETDTVWSFPDRGEWATHTGNYRGNWSPYIPRNLIEKYTEPGDLVLDPMLGSGTTLVECKLLGRNGIGVDINRDAVMVARDRLYFSYTRPLDWPPEGSVRTFVGDCRSLDAIESDSVELVATHPPYAGIISYSKSRVQGDLSSLNLSSYVSEIRNSALDAYRVLKPGKHCAILIGDTRKRLHYVPISMRVLLAFLDVGFILREDIIKRQWNTTTGLGRWRGREYPFYKIAHEHLYVFRKPEDGEKLGERKNSAKWWAESSDLVLNGRTPKAKTS
jgi:DNA modification methylase